MSSTENNPVPLDPDEFSDEAPEGWEPPAPPGSIPRQEDKRYGSRATYRGDVTDRNFLADVRLASGRTTQQIADELGVTTSAVSLYMRPGNDLRMSTIRKFIEACEGEAHIIIELPTERMKIIL